MKCRYRISQNTPGLWHMKAHTRWNALNKELFCGVYKRNTLSKIKIDQHCWEMRFIKTSVNLHRILEFVFRNISLDKLLLSLFHRFWNYEITKGHSGLSEQRWVYRATGAKTSERCSPLWRKYDRYALRYAPASLRSHALAATKLQRE